MGWGVGDGEAICKAKLLKGGCLGWLALVLRMRVTPGVVAHCHFTARLLQLTSRGAKIPRN